MKKSDMALLIFMVAVIGLAVYFAGNALFSQQTSKPTVVETATAINSSVADPSAKVFNEQSINPTVPISIGNGQAAR